MIRYFIRVMFLFLSTFLLLEAPNKFNGSCAFGASSFKLIRKGDDSVFSEYWVLFRNVNLYDQVNDTLHEKMDVLIVNERIYKVSKTPMFFGDVDLTYNINGEGRTLISGIFNIIESTVEFTAENFIREESIADIIVIDADPVVDSDGFDRILNNTNEQGLNALKEVCLVMKKGEVVKNTLPDTKVHPLRLRQYREKRKMLPKNQEEIGN